MTTTAHLAQGHGRPSHDLETSVGPPDGQFGAVGPFHAGTVASSRIVLGFCGSPTNRFRTCVITVFPTTCAPPSNTPRPATRPIDPLRPTRSGTSSERSSSCNGLQVVARAMPADPFRATSPPPGTGWVPASTTLAAVSNTRHRRYEVSSPDLGSATGRASSTPRDPARRCRSTRDRDSRPRGFRQKHAVLPTATRARRRRNARRLTHH